MSDFRSPAYEPYDLDTCGTNLKNIFLKKKTLDNTVKVSSLQQLFRRHFPNEQHINEESINSTVAAATIHHTLAALYQRRRRRYSHPI
jgi:hypothetical protein